MKKIISLMLILTILFSVSALVGCESFGGGATITTSTTRTFMPTTTTTKYLEEPESFGDEVSLKTKFEIINLFLLWSGIQTDKKPEEIDCEFFGQFGDSVAVYFQTAGAYFQKGYDFVADFYFHYPDSRRIKVFNNGKLYSLSDAYQSGMITRDNVCAIYYKYSSMVIKDPYLVYFAPKILYNTTFPQAMSTEAILVTIDPALYTPGKILTEEFFKDIPNIEKIELYQEGPTGHFNEETQIYTLWLEVRSTEKLIQAFYDAIKVNGICFAEPYVWGICSSGAESTYYINSANGEVLGAPLLNIDLPKVWSFTSGSSAVRVGVLDTGADPHEDLNGNYESGFDFLNTGANNPIEQMLGESYHGTHVAGIIGAVGDNGKGIYGINKDVSLVQLRISSLGETNPIITANAINWAAQSFNTNTPIKILNASLIAKSDENLENAIINYTNAGGLFVCAAGNGYGDLDKQAVYPAGYSNEINNMIVVGALNSTFDDLWFAEDDGFIYSQGSNWGADTVDIYAPGENILSTYPTDLCGEDENICTSPEHHSYGYHYMSGTSAATPIVTGVAALLWSISPELTAEQIKDCILEGADEITITTKDGEIQTVKKLNAWGAFKYLMDNYYQMPSATIESLPITVTGTIVSNGDYFVNNTYMQKFIASESGYYDFTVSSGDAIDVTLYDANFNEIPVIYTTTQNGNTVQFAYGLEEEKTYYVRSSFNNSVTVPTSIVINVSDHTHEYSNAMYIDINVHTESCIHCGYDVEESHNLPENWMYKDGSNHKKNCLDCNGEILEAHIVRISEVVNERAPCIHCGWFINVGDFSGVIHQMPKVSLNGSYILPNGVIVLVDEDVEAYLNGTLVFYDRDKLPETE